MITVEQCKQIVRQYLAASGRGGFLTGRVTATAPLSISLESGLQLLAADLYVTDSCIGLSINLRHKHGDSSESLKNNVALRCALQVGDGVLLISRPGSTDGAKYILLDRIQPYAAARGVSAL